MLFTTIYNPIYKTKLSILLPILGAVLKSVKLIPMLLSAQRQGFRRQQRQSCLAWQDADTAAHRVKVFASKTRCVVH